MHRSKITRLCCHFVGRAFSLRLILLLTLNFSPSSVTTASGKLLTVAQQTYLDSLFSVWQDETQSDTTRGWAYYEYIWEGFLFSNPDSAIVLAQTLIIFGEQHKHLKGNAYGLIGLANRVKGDYVKALENYELSIKIEEEIGYKRGVSAALGNIGNVYVELGEYSKALEYHERSLKMSEEIGDKEIIANSIGNIGNIYYYQGDYPKALDYYQRSFKIIQENGDKRGIATALGNIGTVYNDQGDYPKALEYQERSLKIYQEFGDKRGIASALNSIGNIYDNQVDYPKALEYYQRSFKIFKEIGVKSGIASSILGIGIIYQVQGDYPKALEYCKKALIISQEIGALDREKGACKCLYDTYKAMGKGNEALVYLEKINVIDDSLNAAETSKKLQRMEFVKQVFADSMANVEKERLVEETHREEVRQKDKTRNIAFGLGGLVLLLAGGIYSRLRYVRKSKASLQVEKDRSENLLLNILPADIAAELKANGKAEARDFDLVSILFTDFKEFTQTSEKLTAQELVSEINTCFEAFDAICEKYEVEKIKTIGDSYMGAGGLPVPTDDSVKKTVLAALEMQAFITKRKAENEAQNKPAFEMRVGIHTGPVVAGIVGVKKFQYDIWGDTVNTASRMESNGEVGKVNISQSTYELIKNERSLPAEGETEGGLSLPAAGRFELESRGKIKAKGKGEIEMFFVHRST